MFSWLNRWFGRGSPAASAVQAHLTFGATSVGRSISRTGLILKKQLWIWPIIAVVLLAVIGYGIRSAIERTMKASLQSELETLVTVEKAMLEKWLKIQEPTRSHWRTIRRFADSLRTFSRPRLATPHPAQKRLASNP